MSRSRLFSTLPLAVGLAAALAAHGAGYDPVARSTLSPNDVKAFVYQWFAGFDHQAPLESFTRVLDPAGVKIRCPDFPVDSVADFQRWYQGVIDNIAWNAHDVRQLEVIPRGARGFDVTLDVCWQARTHKGETLSVLVNQRWHLAVNADNQLRVSRLIAEAKGAC